MNKFIILISTVISFLFTASAFAVDNPIKNINEGSYTDEKCNEIGEGFLSFEGGKLKTSTFHYCSTKDMKSK